MLDHDLRKMAGNQISDEFKQNAKLLRQLIVKEFDKQFRDEIPNATKGSGRFWVVPLNRQACFYVSLVFPKYLEGDSRFEIVYHVSRVDDHKLTEAMYGVGQKVVKFPYNIHHQLFEFPETPWWKPKIGYLYWKLLMQRKKVYYYTAAQTEYSSRVLLSYAISTIKQEYIKQKTIFEGTDKTPKDIF